jgi:transcriptional regulator with XRE-family HTH domain
VVAVMTEVGVVARQGDDWVIDPRGLATLVRSTRRRLALSQLELAERAGVDQKVISNIETLHVRRAPSPRVLQGLSRALGLSESELLRSLGFLADAPAPAETDVDAVYTAWQQQAATLDGIGDLERQAIMDAISLARRIRQSERD